MGEGLTDFLAAVATELGRSFPLQQPSSDTGQTLPPPLADFYSQTDGLDLPFVQIFSQADVKDSGVPGWLIFGADPYASFCLCRSAAPWDLDFWDHDSGLAPEGAFRSVVELLHYAYDATWDSVTNRPCRVVVRSIPDAVPLATVVGLLKSLKPASFAALLGELRDLPMTLESTDRAQAVRALRTLLAKGVECHWEAA
jgi:hypothetical protein